MNNILKGITYSYHRNIGRQDKIIRSILGFAAILGSVYSFMNLNPVSGVLYGVLALAQIGTILSSRCPICYFSGMCTIDQKERKSLESRGILYEK